MLSKARYRLGWLSSSHSSLVLLFITAHQSSRGKVMFPVMSVCQSICPQGSPCDHCLLRHWSVAGHMPSPPPKTCSLGDPQPNPPVHMGTPSTSVPWEIFKFVHLGTCSYPLQICSNLLPPANEVWRKVMFLHLSVIHSVHGGGAVLSRGCHP